MALALHPTLDIIASGGRDSVLRIWDMRTKQQVQFLEGHSDAILDVLSQNNEPQFTTSSDDKTIRLWDIRTGKSTKVLTNHSKGVRALCQPEGYNGFISASTDNIKVWQYPDGVFERNISGHNNIVNCLAVNQEGVMVSAADDGTIKFWDFESGECFQEEETILQTGSLSCESAIFSVVFDRSGMRMITTEMDKSIKMWKPINEEL